MSSRFSAILVLCGAALAASACGDSTAPADARAGSRIVFTVLDSATQRSTVFAMAPDGSDRAQLSSAGDNEVFPALSPDGRRMVFLGATPLLPNIPQVFIRETGSTGRTQLTFVTAGATAPSWTPDGRVLFFNRDEGRAWVMRADGTGATRISSEAYDEFTPAMSPDGRRIAFATSRHSVQGVFLFELYVMNADGTGQARLTTTSGVSSGFNMYPAWSPDSRRIAFVRWVDAGKARIWVIDADGSELHQLVPQLSPNVSDRFVSWSPDGRQVVFERATGGVSDIFVANADGREVRNITNTPNVNEQSPHWGVAP